MTARASGMKTLSRWKETCQSEIKVKWWGEDSIKVPVLLFAQFCCLSLDGDLKWRRVRWERMCRR